MVQNPDQSDCVPDVGAGDAKHRDTEAGGGGVIVGVGSDGGEDEGEIVLAEHVGHDGPGHLVQRQGGEVITIMTAKMVISKK